MSTKKACCNQEGNLLANNRTCHRLCTCLANLQYAKRLPLMIVAFWLTTISRIHKRTGSFDGSYNLKSKSLIIPH